jgi:hypothetical protein
VEKGLGDFFFFFFFLKQGKTNYWGRGERNTPKEEKKDILQKRKAWRVKRGVRPLACFIFSLD